MEARLHARANDEGVEARKRRAIESANRAHHVTANSASRREKLNDTQLKEADHDKH